MHILLNSFFLAFNDMLFLRKGETYGRRGHIGKSQEAAQRGSVQVRVQARSGHNEM